MALMIHIEQACNLIALYVAPVDTSAAPSLPESNIRSRRAKDQPTHITLLLSVEVEALCSGYDSRAEAIIGLLGNSQVLKSTTISSSK